MGETVNCPACSAQFPYMPDMVGLSVNCPKCRHPFVVTAPKRRARMEISIPAPPPSVASNQPVTPAPLEAAIAPAAQSTQSVESSLRAFFQSTSTTTVAAPARSSHPLDLDLSLPGEQPGEPYQVDAMPPPLVETSHDSVASSFDSEEEPDASDSAMIPTPVRPPPMQVRDLDISTGATPAPAPRPRVVVKRPPREWTTADKTFFNLAIIVILIAGLFLLLPLTGMDLKPFGRLREIAPLAGTLMIVIGLVTCAVVAFRQFAKWVFLITSGAFGLIIIGLFAYAAIKSPGSYEAPALAQADAPARPVAASANAAPAVEAIAPAAPATAAATVATVAAAEPPPVAANNPGPTIAYEALTSRYGPHRVVRVTVPTPDNKPPDPALASRAHESLSPLAPSWYVSRQSDHLECILAPVENFENFVGQVRSVGSPSDVNFDQRTLTVRLP